MVGLRIGLLLLIAPAMQPGGRALIEALKTWLSESEPPTLSDSQPVDLVKWYHDGLQNRNRRFDSYRLR